MRVRSSSRISRPFALIVLLITGLAAIAGPGSAETGDPLAPRFSTQDRAEVVVIGGPTIACDPLPCRPIDADTDPTSASSATAVLDLGDRSSVAFAGLYWSGFADGLEREFVRFAPAGSAYRAVFADDVEVDGARYQSFADVTDIVGAAGAGSYTVADVASGLADGAGWSLVVVSVADELPTRAITVLDGLSTLVDGSSLGVGGFRTPAADEVGAQIAMVAYGGDDREEIRFQGRPLWSAQRAPDDLLATGFDIATVTADGRLGNRATSGRLDVSTTGEGFELGVLTTAIDVASTDISAARAGRSADAAAAAAGDGGQADLRIVNFASPSPYVPGDLLFITTQVGNDGPDAVVGATVTSPVPTGATDATWTCALASGVGSCSDEGGADEVALSVDLEPGAMIAIEMIVTAPTDGSAVTVVASIEAPEGIVDPGPAPNEAGVVVSPGDTALINLPPVFAVDDSVTVSAGGIVRVDVLSNDSDPDNEIDPTSVRALEPPGVATEDGVTGELLFDIPTDFVGEIAVIYQVCDVGAACAEAEATVTVTGGDPLPETGADVGELAQASATLFVLGAFLVGFGRRRFAR